MKTKISILSVTLGLISVVLLLTLSASAANTTANNQSTGSSTGSSSQNSNQNNNQSSASQTSSKYDYLSIQSFSASAFTTDEKPTGCDTNQTGQFIVLAQADVSSGSPVYLALSNESTWTKRGKLYPISDGKQDLVKKIIEESKNANAMPNPDETKKNVEKFIAANSDSRFLSGAVFKDVPINQSLTLYIQSERLKEDNKDMAFVASGIKISKPCANYAFFLNSNAWADKDKMSYFKSEGSLTDNYKICVHSEDRNKNYEPKKTFLTQDKKGIDDFTKENNQSVVSLGPCQDSEQVKKNADENKNLSDQPNNTNTNNTNSALSPAPELSESKGLGITQGDISGANNSFSSNTSNSSNFDIETFRQKALDKINELRREKGLSPVKLDSKLNDFARKRHDYLITNNFPQHEGFEEQSAELIAEFGWHGASENRCYYYFLGSIDEIVNEIYAGYKQHPGHYENIINPRATVVGIDARIVDGNGRVFELEDYGMP